MKICPKCKDEHDKPGTYCSRKCANSRNFSLASRRKKSVSNQKHWINLPEEEKKRKLDILSRYPRYRKENYVKNVLGEDWNELGLQSKRLRVILEQKGKCNQCGITEWMGERITLEYEHKDGNKENNSRENVEALCPNCHSMTKTWRGRKNRKRQSLVERCLREASR